MDPRDLTAVLIGSASLKEAAGTAGDVFAGTRVNAASFAKRFWERKENPALLPVPGKAAVAAAQEDDGPPLLATMSKAAKKKAKGQKLDISSLGFSVNPVDLPNRGDIERI